MMGKEAAPRASHDPAARGHDGRLLSPVPAPAPGEALSPAWLAQLGRAPIGDYAGDRQVLKRLTDDGLAVPGDDPLYQYLGAQRMFAVLLQAQHDDHTGRMLAMQEQAQRGLGQLLADVGAAGAAALLARRAEDEAALKRFSAALEDRTANATRKLREALAEERDAITAAVAMKMAEALALIESEKTPRAARGGLAAGLAGLGPALAVRGRSAAAWAALLSLSVLAGLALLWAFGHLGSIRGVR